MKSPAFDATTPIFACLVNIGIIASNAGNFKKAHEYFTTALTYLESEKCSKGLMEQFHGRIHLELGEIYRFNNNFAEAKNHLDKAENIAKNTSANKELLFWIRMTQARIAREEGDQIAVNAILADAKELADTPDKIEALKKFG